MSARQYLPSTQFMVIAGSLAAAAGLVAAAQYYTSSHAAPASLAAQATAQDPWLQTLEDIQTQSGVALPQPPDEAEVSALLSAAQSKNITDTVSRSLLVNLTAAGAQGLGSDLPTQDRLIEEAWTELQPSLKAQVYASSDLTVVNDSSEAFRAYGNGVMQALFDHPGASARDTFAAVGYTVDNGDAAQLKKLAAIAGHYASLTRSLLGTPVPRSLAPLHLQMVNSFGRMTAAYEGMQELGSDPLRGLISVQQYVSLTDEAGRVFINIAEALKSGGILFTKDEPGSAWDTFLSAP